MTTSASLPFTAAPIIRRKSAMLCPAAGSWARPVRIKSNAPADSSTQRHRQTATRRRFVLSRLWHLCLTIL